MKTITKIKLDVCSEQTIRIPKDYILLEVRQQFGDIFLFAFVETDAEVIDLTIKCYGDNYKMPDEAGIYLGSAICGADAWFYYLEL